MFDDFDGLVVTATDGHGPYPYQRRLAEHGFPELLWAPTGSGNTLAATLPWPYHRRFAPDLAIRRDTPLRLVIMLPQRVLVEQTHTAIAGWLRRPGLTDEVGLHVLMGGVSADQASQAGGGGRSPPKVARPSPHAAARPRSAGVDRP